MNQLPINISPAKDRHKLTQSFLVGRINTYESVARVYAIDIGE